MQEFGLTPDEMREGVRLALAAGTLQDVGPNLVAPRDIAEAEVAVADHIRRLSEAPLSTLEVPAHAFDFEPSPEQRMAVDLVARSGVVVLTGGPGCGKTATTKAIMRMFEWNGVTFAGCALAAQAAKRLSEASGFPAMTLHRTLGLRGGHGGADAAERLAVKACVLDEASMVEVRLFAALTGALETGARLVIVGDVDQLPSIGPGQVLADLIASGAVPVVRLERIFRQAEGNRIPEFARDVKLGRVPDLRRRGTDITFVDEADEARLLGFLLHYVSEVIPQQKGIAVSDIMVLSPQNSELLGVQNLNHVLQQRLNPVDSEEGQVFIRNEHAVGLDDVVMQTANDYDLDIFNGDVGRVLAADPRGLDPNTVAFLVGEPRQGAVLVVEFLDHRVALTRSQAKALTLAYASTVHKRQGGQAPGVVVVVSEQHRYMLTRPLLYTAITRAAQFCLILGTEQVFARAVQNTRGTIRRTRLTRLLT